jgi:hypothetical protein
VGGIKGRGVGLFSVKGWRGTHFSAWEKEKTGNWGNFVHFRGSEDSFFLRFFLDFGRFFYLLRDFFERVGGYLFFPLILTYNPLWHIHGILLHFCVGRQKLRFPE